METTRIGFRLSSKLNEELDGISADLGISRTEMFRRALSLMRVAYQAHAEGKNLAITADGKNVETLIFGID